MGSDRPARARSVAPASASSPRNLRSLPPPDATPASRILFVCTANSVRSPIATAVFARVQRDRGAERFAHVTSAGIRARPNCPCDPTAERVAAAHGLDISAHRTQRVTPEHLDSHLVLAMEESQRVTLVRLRPDALPRTFTLLEFLRLRPRLEIPSTDLAATVLCAHRLRPRTARLDHPEDVPDPHRGPEEGYAGTVRLLEGLVTQLAELILPEPASTAGDTADE